LLDALADIGGKLERGEKPGAALETALDLFADLPPGRVAQADRIIAMAAKLNRRLSQSASGRSIFDGATDSDVEQLLTTSGLEYLFLFHRDGRLREAALLKITGGIPSPFLVAAVLWRLNDWAVPVREAAVRCANRSLPLTAPAVVARTAAALLVRQLSWGRWGEERAVVDHLFARDDVVEHLAGLIGSDATGPIARALRHALRTPALDPYLQRIASEAVQPYVRAVALDALINGEAEWRSGFAWQWTDKSMGNRRRIAVYDHRTLTVSGSREALIARGVEDRSAIVRRVALNGVIRHLLGTPKGREYAAMLIADRAPSVRERAEFVLRSKTN
jgi:hypothetical protein